jgi:CRP-like cAMP-binding protein
VIEALSKPADARTDEDIYDLILPEVKNVEIIKEIKPDAKSDDELKFIAERFRYEYAQQGERVIEYGDRGDQFYVLLEGTVIVLVPTDMNEGSNE